VIGNNQSSGPNTHRALRALIPYERDLTPLRRSVARCARLRTTEPGGLYTGGAEEEAKAKAEEEAKAKAKAEEEAKAKAEAEVAAELERLEAEAKIALVAVAKEKAEAEAVAMALEEAACKAAALEAAAMEAAAKEAAAKEAAAKEVEAAADADEPPDDLICPITQELMNNPVIAADGHTYERVAIERWLKTNTTHRIRQVRSRDFECKILVSNHLVCRQIREWKERVAGGTELNGC